MRLIVLRLNCLLVSVSVAVGTSTLTADDSFEKVAPLLSRRCLGCHNASERAGGLDLTTRATALQGGENGPALEPGAPDDSLLIEKVTSGEMPPKGGGPKLSAAEQAALQAWIQEGAAWPETRTLSAFDFTTDQRAGRDWWSLQPIKQPEPPAVQGTDWVRTPVDAFILERLEQHGWQPAGRAERLVLLRRITLDLLGLPPTVEQIDTFLADDSPDAVTKLIDRCLASPQYGERWARHWLDVVRYGESDGFENDKLRDHAWRYRDYVIDSLNLDKPYDQFVREQLAGDVLEPVTQTGIVASGFLVAGSWDEIQNVGSSQTERQRAHEEQLEELVAAVSQTFLGLTVNCARCHDHKFDPITQVDYYRLKAVFDGVEHGNRPLLTPAEQVAYEAQAAPLREKIRLAKEQLGPPPEAAGVVLDTLALEALAEGRFGKALDARRAAFARRSREAFRTWPLTVECWVKCAEKQGFNIFVAQNLKSAGDHWELYSYAGGGDFSVYLPGYEPAELRSGVDVCDDQWHHVAWTCDGKIARLYVDAKLAKEFPITRKREPGPAGLLTVGLIPEQKIGCAGLIDEVRISHGLRVPERLPDAAFTADDTTLGLWHFDEAVRPTEDTLGTLLAEQRAALEKDLKQAEQELASLGPALVYSGIRRQPAPTVLFQRGDILQPGAVVPPGGLSALAALVPDLALSPETPESERRQRFAEWVTDPRNPLTARVIVNRVWQQHFGQGLVETASDFGFQGGQPSHPELLDWLARDFIDHGWSLKHLHRRIMQSAVYQQASTVNPLAAAEDGQNRLLWRFTPRRLEAEAIRDSMLAVSGELNPTAGGPSYRPFTVTAILTRFYHLIDPGTPEFNRRTIYRIQVNTARDPFLDALDCPSPSLAMPKRRTTTTPMHALMLMNDPFVLRQAERFADRVQARSPEPAAAISTAWKQALSREPTEEERTAATKLVEQAGLKELCWVLLNSTEFLYIP